MLCFDPETFRYSTTGTKKPIMDLKFDQPAARGKGKIYASELFASNESELSRADIVKRIFNHFDVSEGTAIRWIGDNLAATRRGMYDKPE